MLKSNGNANGIVKALAADRIELEKIVPMQDRLNKSYLIAKLKEEVEEVAAAITKRDFISEIGDVLHTIGLIMHVENIHEGSCFRKASLKFHKRVNSARRSVLEGSDIRTAMDIAKSIYREEEDD